jgi:hypothetical protein
LLLLTAVPAAARAQGPWGVTVAGGAVGFSAAARISVETLDEVEVFKPSATTRLRLAVERDFGSLSGRIAFGYAKAGVSATSGDLQIIFSPGLDLKEVWAMAGYRFATLGNASRAVVRLGPVLQVWSGDAIPGTRKKLGVAGSVALEATLTPRFGLSAEGSLSYAGGPFAPADFSELPVSYDVSSVWTRELAVGLRYCW